jgi:hypothetical protein
LAQVAEADDQDVAASDVQGLDVLGFEGLQDFAEGDGVGGRCVDFCRVGLVLERPAVPVDQDGAAGDAFLRDV